MSDMNILLLVLIACAFGGSRDMQTSTFHGAAIVDGQIVEPPLEFSGVGSDTLRLNGIPVEPVRGAPGPRLPQLTETEVRRWELHFAAGSAPPTMEYWSSRVAYAESVYAVSGMVKDVQEWSGGLLVYWKGSTQVDSIPRWRYFDPSRPPTRENYRRERISELTRAVDAGCLVVMCPGVTRTFSSPQSPELFQVAKLILSGDPIPEDTMIEYQTLIELRDLVSCWRCGRDMPR